MIDRRRLSWNLPRRSTSATSRLALLLIEMAEELRQKRRPTWRRCCRLHPDLAEELRSLWAAVLVAEGAATASSTSGELKPSGKSSGSGSDAVTLALGKTSPHRAAPRRRRAAAQGVW